MLIILASDMTTTPPPWSSCAGDLVLVQAREAPLPHLKPFEEYIPVIYQLVSTALVVVELLLIREIYPKEPDQGVWVFCLKLHLLDKFITTQVLASITAN